MIWTWLLVVEILIVTGLLLQPVHANSSLVDYTVKSGIDQQLEPKPVETWDNKLKPILAARDKQIADQKVADEAAAEAQRQAAAQAAQAQLAVVREVQTPQGSCSDWMAQAGITDTVNAYWIIMRESGCNPNALNRSSGAEGIAQALPYSKTGCAHGDAICQLQWMQGYVNSRYGGWAGAVAFWQAHNWY